jgi:hypothetical protein
VKNKNTIKKEKCQNKIEKAYRKIGYKDSMENVKYHVETG